MSITRLVEGLDTYTHLSCSKGEAPV